MIEKVLIFALVRSGGSFVSQTLSAGLPVLTEPPLPADGESLTINVQRLLDFHAASFQVAKLIRFKEYIDLAEDRRAQPPAASRFFLFRHPYTQIASYLFTFCDWADNWAPRQSFHFALKAYREHWALFQRASALWPPVGLLRYEDARGDGLEPFLASVYGKNAVSFLPFAKASARKNFRLGPVPGEGEWAPGAYELTPKEKYWVREALADVMEALGYG